MLGGVHGIWPITENWSVVWDAAYDFTKERERQIAEIEEEIQWLETVQSIFYSNKNRAAAKKRILAREQAVLQEMRRGMRSERNG